jgi:hypothetical protein
MNKIFKKLINKNRNYFTKTITNFNEKKFQPISKNRKDLGKVEYFNDIPKEELLNDVGQHFEEKRKLPPFVYYI